MNYCGKKETIGHGEFLICGQPRTGVDEPPHVCDACKASEMRLVLQVLIDADEWALMEDDELWERARRAVAL